MKLQSYTMLSRNKVIKACQDTISSIDDKRINLRAEVIEKIKSKKTWFGMGRCLSHEEAVYLYENSSFDSNFEVFLEKISSDGYCNGQRKICEKILKLCLSSNEELIAITAEDFDWFGHCYV